MGRLRLTAEVACTRAEGPFRRYALWVAGCSLRCPGCCNPEFFDPGAGQTVELERLLERIDAAREAHAIEGITILGGEPLEQIEGVTELAREVSSRGLGVIVFSGYRLEEALEREGFAELWALIDALVDGPYDPRRASSRAPHPRRYIGSTNQRLHHRSRRYEDPARWRGEASAEVQIASDGLLSIHGEPGLSRELGRSLRVLRRELV